MTELAMPDNNRAPAIAESAPGDALMQWAAHADLAYQMAVKLAATSFVPQSMQGKPGEVTAAILAGQELGLQPMAALRSMDIIGGTPALRAHAMRGLVQSKGHHVQLVESTPERCVVRGRRAGEAEWQEVEWTLERAAALGLTGKNEWKKQPKTMLVARATGEICRLIAADVLYAMPYASEELDLDAAPAPQPTRRVTVGELTGAAPAEPETEPAPPADEVDGWPPVTPPGSGS